MLILILNLLLDKIFSFINLSDTDDKSGYSNLSLGAVGLVIVSVILISKNSFYFFRYIFLLKTIMLL